MRDHDLTPSEPHHLLPSHISMIWQPVTAREDLEDRVIKLGRQDFVQRKEDYQFTHQLQVAKKVHRRFQKLPEQAVVFLIEDRYQILLYLCQEALSSIFSSVLDTGVLAPTPSQLEHSHQDIQQEAVT